MQVKIISVPVVGGEDLNEELNIFLRSKKVIQVDQEFVGDGQGARWCFCIKYVDDNTPNKNREKVDYKLVLDAPSFQRYTALKEIRKRVAAEDDVPAYAVFSDWELSEMSKIEELTLAQMKKVKGIGEKKVEKYGRYFIQNPDDEKIK